MISGSKGVEITILTDRPGSQNQKYPRILLIQITQLVLFKMKSKN